MPSKDEEHNNYKYYIDGPMNVMILGLEHGKQKPIVILKRKTMGFCLP